VALVFPLPKPNSMKRFACLFTEAKNCRATSDVSSRSRFLGEHGVIPHRVVHAQVDEPAKEQVVDLLDQLALRPNRLRRLPQQRPQRILRHHRRPARGRIQAVELLARERRTTSVMRRISHNG
jgi:hypothetical protein